MKEVKEMNIYERLSAISEQIERVAKNLKVSVGSGSYKAVSEADVITAVKPLEASYGVYSYPFSRRIVESGELETKNGNKNLFLRIETVYRFVNIDKPEEFVDVYTYGDGVDSQDKAPGKAMTYADKYALLKAYKIQTGDDPDANGSEELKGTTLKKATNGNHSTVETKPATKTATESQYSQVLDKIKNTEITIKDVAKWIELTYKKDIRVNDLNLDQFANLMFSLDKKLNPDEIQS